VIACLEDTDLNWRIQLAGEPLVFATDAVAQCRLRPEARGAAMRSWSSGSGGRWPASRYGAVWSALRAAEQSTSGGWEASVTTVTSRSAVRRVTVRGAKVARPVGGVRSRRDPARRRDSWNQPGARAKERGEAPEAGRQPSGAVCRRPRTDPGLHSVRLVVGMDGWRCT